MPRYFCDYCDVYLTHDSAPGRKQHIRGWKHRENVKQYYEQFMKQFYEQNAGLHGMARGRAGTWSCFARRAYEATLLLPSFPDDARRCDPDGAS